MTVIPGRSGSHLTIEPKKTVVCPNAEKVERRALRSRLKPVIDVLTIAVLIGCLHLVLRLVVGMGNVIIEMRDQTNTIKHIDNNINKYLDGDHK